MKAGKIVEAADAETLFDAPQHDYTRNLIQLIPRVENVRAHA
jgi:peptide/nickel transport system ATP-binding protein